MKKYLYMFIATLALASVALATESQIWGEMRIQNILGYGQEESLKLGVLFTFLQSKYFAWIFLAVLIGVPTVFFVHYKLVGPKVFPHSHKKHYAFNLFHRTVHQVAAVSFLVLVPTGFIIVFGDFFGGGTLVRMAKNLHGIFTIPFAIVVIPMALMWLKEALFNFEDVKWFMILGGYLSKEKQIINAGQFNAGQKMWYWVAILGGITMILSGAMMFFLDFKMEMLHNLTGLSQIDLLRVAAIVHNVMGFAVVALFITHVYMSMFAIKGAVNSIITGYVEEEEVKFLHNAWYKKLKEKGKF
ncbi:formate dehydrogenase subunit gamma [Sulfurospirillum deleyianum]|uniref:Formate dehydrogenase, gamma subunit n=1 Tax=Sulfurospirillum deleyianum (strain ATCC 51133 / DSM 6946 / 5175) TaxID=525898 RepID=D1B169_SULD5|nr:formate dehydrogenase subunit gamma [Sulfurospirillum deleyianum]ACZ11839.1 formate dehydrogenase, gamma subunit [Sulfurospirillum deleyianum DSM 6946]